MQEFQCIKALIRMGKENGQENLTIVCLHHHLYMFLIPVRIVEDLLNGFALGRLREADHVVGGADLHEGEARLQRYINRNTALFEVG